MYYIIVYNDVQMRFIECIHTINRVFVTTVCPSQPEGCSIIDGEGFNSQCHGNEAGNTIY